MKKSKKLCLVLMGALISGATGCSESITQEEQNVFRSQAECTAAGHSTEQCAQMEAQAKADAPKFGTREECEQQYGKEMCQGSSSSGYWTPMLLGFMAGNLMSNAFNSGHSAPDIDKRDIKRPNSVPAATGLYNDPNSPGSYKTGKGISLEKSQSGKGVLSKTITPKGAVSRGGFGGGRVGA